MATLEAPLTAYQRLTLINQFKILSSLAKGSNAASERETYAEWIKILEHGYVRRYSDICWSLDDEMSEQDCVFVSDVLTMFRALHYYLRDGGAPLSQGTHTTFKGFCGNTEGQLRSYAVFLIEKEGQWDEQKPHAALTHGFNSHMPKRELYGRMLTVFDALSAKGFVKLTKDQWEQVLAAAPHSSGIPARR